METVAGILGVLCLCAWPGSGVFIWAMLMRDDYGDGWFDKKLSGFDLWGLVLAIFYGPVFAIAILSTRR